jgi:hypothetical protein
VIAAFAAGFAFGVLFLYAIYRFEKWDVQRVAQRRMGYLDFTFSSSNTKGGTHQLADSMEGPSEGGHVTPPSHLRLVKGENDAP